MPCLSRARRALPWLACTALLLAPATSHAQDVGTNVVGGTTADAGEYPWQVQVDIRKGQSQFLCGGTLIADQRVLTAAHCMPNGSTASVRVGSHTLDAGTVIGVTSYARHPNYSSNTSRFDAAVLELAASGTAAGGEVLQLVGQQGSGDDSLWAAGKSLAISGWGTTSESGNLSTQLREARVPRVADSTCGQSDYYGSSFDPATMVCGGFPDGGVDTCQGDSGGPLAASTQDPPPASENDPSQWRLVGITSWGQGCARPKKPGVYTRVAAPAIRNWILGTNPTPLFALSVSLTGTGSGTVTDTGHAGTISCPPTCSFSYDGGTVVTLTANPSSGSAFTGWSGSGCSGSGTCTVTMSQARSVTAQFTNTSPTPTMRTLTVGKQGSGTVTSSPAGINCGTTCSATFTDGTSVTLTATPASGSVFAGWEGENCSGTGTCTVSMTAARNVVATFGVVAQEPPPPDNPPPDEPPADQPPPTGGGTTTQPPPDSTPAPDQVVVPPVLAITSENLRVSRRGYVRVPLKCKKSGTGKCVGIVRIRARLPAEVEAAARELLTIGHAEFRISVGDTKRVRFRLTRRARRLIRFEGELVARVVVFATDSDGKTHKFVRKVTLRPARPST